MKRTMFKAALGLSAATLLTTGTAFAGSMGCGGPLATTCMAPQFAPVAAQPVMVAPAPQPVFHQMPAPVAPSYCAPGVASENCAPAVKVLNSPPVDNDPVTVRNHSPMDYLRSVNFSGSPHVSITRVYGQQELVGLEDAPTGFSGGCSPHSTSYCGAQTSPPVGSSAPIASSWATGSYHPQPMMGSHIVEKKGHIVAVRADGTYWENVGGQVLAYPSVVTSSAVSAPYVAPPMQVTAPTSGNMYTGIQSDGTYWEQVSGPTMVGGLPATQVICKRQAQVQYVQPQPVQVVNPVIGVPTPVPVPVQVPAMDCGPAMMPHMGARFGRYGH